MLAITREDIAARLRFDNPWWDTSFDGKIRYQDMPRRRYFQKFFKLFATSLVIEPLS
jgi:hypothetical protein